jgi:hypothetical protein
MAYLRYLTVPVQAGEIYNITTGPSELLYRGLPLGAATKLADPSTTLLEHEAVSDTYYIMGVFPGGVQSNNDPHYAETTMTVAGIQLLDEGLPADAHQTTQQTVAMRERSRSVQMKLTNEQGSARWRGCHVAGVPEKGNWK